MLLAPRQIRHVGDHPGVLSGQQLSGFGQALGNNTGLQAIGLSRDFAIGLALLVGLILSKGFTQQFLQFTPLGDLRSLAAARVNQAAEYWGILEGLVHPVQGNGQILLAGLAAELFPFVAGSGDGQATTGQVQFRQRPVTAGIRVAPGFQGHGKGRQFDATLIQFQAVKVFAEYLVDGLAGIKVLGLHAHRYQHQEGSDQEVAGAAAGIEGFKFA
ncbi:hypothetical protein D9M69_534000 [compost metagenome]